MTGGRLAAARSGLAGFYQSIIVDLGRQLRWSFLPPLMVYLAAGLANLTNIVGTFFVKDYLGLSAAFLAGLAFWAGLPWALKIPLGHLVDLIWRYKAGLVYLGAALISASFLIMWALIAHRDFMTGTMAAGGWYVLSALLAPVGYVLQDTVADAMSVEAVPTTDAAGRPLGEDETKALHTTMQTLGRIALISGLVFVALLNIVLFSGVETMDPAVTAPIYAQVYLSALAVPAISVAGVLLAPWLKPRRAEPPTEKDAETPLPGLGEGGATRPNTWILGGGAAFVAMTVAVGLSGIAWSEEIVFVASMAIVSFLVGRLARELEPAKARALIGTAIIIFVFRATPLPGAGATWFQIDVLDFDQQFIAVLTLITSVLTLAGMIVLRPLMAHRTIVYIVILLTVAASVLALPNIGLYYGIHEWTARWTGGIVDARFIAIIDTAIESPLGQVAMIPMLAWIARNAPSHLKATFFAVMASFTNLALSASSLATRYLNEFFVVTREVREGGAVTVPADYSELGLLLMTAAAIGLVAPLITIAIVQATPLRSPD
jgi:BT1 family